MVFLCWARPSPREQKTCIDKSGDFNYDRKYRGATVKPALILQQDVELSDGGFSVNHTRVLVGSGPETYEKGKSALQNWRHFGLNWAFVDPKTPIQTGVKFCVCVKELFPWLVMPLKVVYVNENRNPKKAVASFSFGSGTLAGHLLAGEESFSITLDENNKVWYEILSFSKPISGAIPKCLNNFTAMVQEVDIGIDYITMGPGDFESATVMWKRKEYEYINTLRLVKLVDLSSNNLVGDIPAEITNLVMLVGLNLSSNNLSGILPAKIGQLRSLDFLDLSRNHFSGGIPIGVSQLDQLGVLDLSYNNLSGKIPQNIHLQTFDASAFEGNPDLCGLPLNKTCPGDEIPQDPKIIGNANGMKDPDEEEDKLISDGFYISMAVGFVFGFWGVCGTLVFNNSWRIAFFKFWNSSMDWLYIKIAISKIRLKEIFHKFVKF
ncbi:protein of unknown function-containing protein [Forsythia ovata]|uniref:DUF1990 domain-containing protein n=1 Tax=Forsythia ovata TaxID=205694 RepID=A0ABD1X1M4_9LAMI